VSLPGSSGVPERREQYLTSGCQNTHCWSECPADISEKCPETTFSPEGTTFILHWMLTSFSPQQLWCWDRLWIWTLKITIEVNISEFKLKDQNGARILWPSGDRADSYGYCHCMHTINCEWFYKVGINDSLRGWNPGITYREQGSWTFMWVLPQQVQISHLGNVASQAYPLCLFTNAHNHVCEKGTNMPGYWIQSPALQVLSYLRHASNTCGFSVSWEIWSSYFCSC
jgi:hypothetical protein